MTNKKIEAVRARIRELKAQQTELEAQTRSRAEVRAQVAALVQGWEDEARKRQERGLRLIAAGDAALTVPFVSPEKLGPSLVLLVGVEQVQRSLLANIELIPEGVGKADREKMFAQIASELDDLEQQEEAMIVAAADAGERVLRRADARPEIVLGRHEEPPAVLPRSPFYQGLGDVLPKRRRFSVYPVFPGREG